MRAGFARALAFVLGIGLVLASVYGLRSVIIAPYVKRVIAARLQSGLGLDVAVGAVGGSYLTSLELKNLETLRPQEGGAVTSAKIAYARLDYSISSLLFGVDAFLAALEVRIRGAQVALDLARRVPEGAGAEEGVSSWYGLPPATLPRMDIQDSSVLVRRTDLKTGIHGITLQTEPDRTRREFGKGRLRIHKVNVQRPGLREIEFSIDSEFLYRPGGLSIETMDVNGAQVVKTAHFSLPRRPEEPLGLNAELQIFGGHGSVRGAMAEGAWDTAFEVQDLDAGELFSALLGPGPATDGTIAARGSVHLIPDRPEALEGSVNFSWLGGAVRGLPLEGVSLSATASEGWVCIEHLEGKLCDNALFLEDVSAPLGPMIEKDVRGLISAAEGRFSATLSDIPGLLTSLGIVSPVLRRQAPLLHTATMRGTFSSGRVGISEARLDSAAGVVQLDDAEASLPEGEYSLWEIPFRAGLVADISDLSRLSSLFALPPAQGAIKARLTVEGTPARPKGMATISGKGLAFKGFPVGNLDVTGRSDGAELAIETLELRNNGDLVTGHGALSMSGRTLHELSLTADIRDIGPYASALFPEHPGAFGRLEGELAARGPVSSPDVQFEGTLSKAGLGVLDVPEGHVKGLFSAGTVHIDEARLRTPWASVSLAGALRKGGGGKFTARLEQVALWRNDRRLDLERPARVSFGPKGVVLADDVILAGNIGTIRIQGEFTGHGKSQLRATASGLSGDGWLDALAGERLFFRGADLSVTLSGPPGALSVRAAGSVKELGHREGRTTFSGTFDVENSPGGLQLRRFEWSSNTGQRLTVHGSVPVNLLAARRYLPGNFSLEAHADLKDLSALTVLFPRLEETMEGAARADLELAGTWSAPSGSLHLEAGGVRAPGWLAPEGSGPSNVDCDVTVRGGAVVLKRLDVRSSQFVFSAAGTWSEIPSLKEVLRGNVRPLQGSLAGTARVNVPDLSWIAERVGGVQRLSGRLDAELSVEGPVRAPEFKGSIRLGDGQLRFLGALPPVRDLFLHAEADKTALRIQSGGGTLGGAAFAISGSILLDEKSGVTTDLRLKGKDLLLFRDEGMKVRGNADLDVHGPLRQTHISGTMDITDGRFVRNFDFLGLLKGSGRPKGEVRLQPFSLTDSPLRDATFDIRISYEKAFQIHNNVASGAVRPALSLRGTGEVPLVVGDIYLDPTKIKLPSGRLDVTSGVIRISEGEPNRPYLDFFGTTRLLGYDIKAVVQGPYDEPVVTLSSIPPLPEDDLLFLLLAGRPPKQGSSREKGLQGTKSVAVYLGKDLIVRWFGDSSMESDESVLERFELEIGRDVTRRGEETIASQFRLVEGGPTRNAVLYITAEKDVFDAINGGLKVVFRFE
jgi:hypothetical protein